MIYLMVAHVLQFPLLCPLGVFWYGVTHREAGFTASISGYAVVECSAPTRFVVAAHPG